jgi:hypothetical protein
MAQKIVKATNSITKIIIKIDNFILQFGIKVL